MYEWNEKYYYDLGECRFFGLRSAPDGLDVAEIAEKFGGGGHKHAAGFRISEAVTLIENKE